MLTKVGRQECVREGAYVCINSPMAINVTQSVPCIIVSGRLLSVGGRVGESRAAFLMTGAINGQENKRDPHL